MPAGGAVAAVDGPAQAEQLKKAVDDLKGHWIITYGSYAAFFVAVLTMVYTVDGIGREFASNAETTAEMAVAVANAAAVRNARDTAWESWADPSNGSLPCNMTTNATCIATALGNVQRCTRRLGPMSTTT